MLRWCSRRPSPSASAASNSRRQVSIRSWSVRNAGGATSIDITQEGVDKAYGLKKLRDESGIPLDAMMFIGDAIFPGGNGLTSASQKVAPEAVYDLLFRTGAW